MDNPTNLIGVYDRLYHATFQARSIVYACQRTAAEQESDLSGALDAAFSTIHDMTVLLQNSAHLFGCEPKDDD